MFCVKVPVGVHCISFTSLLRPHVFHTKRVHCSGSHGDSIWHGHKMLVRGKTRTEPHGAWLSAVHVWQIVHRQCFLIEVFLFQQVDSRKRRTDVQIDLWLSDGTPRPRPNGLLATDTTRVLKTQTRQDSDLERTRHCCHPNSPTSSCGLCLLRSPSSPLCTTDHSLLFHHHIFRMRSSLPLQSASRQLFPRSTIHLLLQSHHSTNHYSIHFISPPLSTNLDFDKHQSIIFCSCCLPSLYSVKTFPRGRKSRHSCIHISFLQSRRRLPCLIPSSFCFTSP